MSFPVAFLVVWSYRLLRLVLSTFICLFGGSFTLLYSLNVCYVQGTLIGAQLHKQNVVLLLKKRIMMENREK